MASIKKNFFWNLLQTVAGYLFPLIVFPYVSRVLGVEKFGNVQAADSIVSYFQLFAMLGMATLGIREVARVKNDKKRLSEVFSSLFLLNIITAILTIVVMLFFIYNFSSFASKSRLLYIGVSRILFIVLSIEWLFKGIEDFSYITKRTLLIKCFYVVAVFSFVRCPDDHVKYFALTCGITMACAIVNLLYARRFVRFSLSNVSFRQFLHPFVILGIYAIMTNMYGTFNVMQLGVYCGDREVGYYSVSVKFFSVIISFFSAFTAVLLPRISYVLSENNEKEFQRITSRSIDFLFLLSFPIIAFVEVFAPEIVMAFSGLGYEGAIIPMRIITPLVFLIGYEQIMVTQILTPLKKDNAIMINSFFGAVMALLLCFILIPRFASVGSALVWVCSECAVAISAQFWVQKYAKCRFPIRMFLLNLCAYIPMLFICLMIKACFANYIYSLSIGVTLASVYFFVCEKYLVRSVVFADVVTFLKSKCSSIFSGGR